MKCFFTIAVAAVAQHGNAFMIPTTARSVGLITRGNSGVRRGIVSVARMVDTTSKKVAKASNEVEDKNKCLRKAMVVEAMAERANLSKVDAEAALVAFMETVADSVSDGKKVNLQGFGTFEPRGRAGRTGRNPRTGETVEIKPTTVPAFAASKAFKDQVKAAHE